MSQDDRDEIRANMTSFYRTCFEDDLALMVGAGDISPEMAAAAVEKALALPVVQATIDSFVARVSGALH